MGEGIGRVSEPDASVQPRHDIIWAVVVKGGAVLVFLNPTIRDISAVAAVVRIHTVDARRACFQPALEAEVEAAVETEGRAVDEVLRGEQGVDFPLAWAIDDDALDLSDIVARLVLWLRCKDEARRAERLGPVLEKDCPLMCAELLGLTCGEILVRRGGSNEPIELGAQRLEVDCVLRTRLLAEHH